MNKGFEYLEHLSDAGIRFYGNNPAELFENAARGMFSIIGNIKNIRCSNETDIEIVSDSGSLEDVLVLWLERLIYHHEVDKMLFSEFNISSLEEQNGKYTLSAVIYGEKIDPARHEINYQ